MLHLPLIFAIVPNMEVDDLETNKTGQSESSVLKSSRVDMKNRVARKKGKSQPTKPNQPHIQK